MSPTEAGVGERGRGLIAIPARLESSRLPRKLLLDETGQPLLAHVIGQAQRAAEQSGGRVIEVVVACDHPELFALAQAAGATAVMTSPDHSCGTTRIAEAVQIIGYQTVDFVINVQGDEPEIAPRAILNVMEALLSDPAADMATLAVPMPTGTEDQKANPNVVKAVLDQHGRAIYFSRAPVPYTRQPIRAGQPAWYHHLGIYAYRTAFLLDYARWNSTTLETTESLEQLRVLEHGHTIRVGLVPESWAGKGIDTADDYRAFVRRQVAA